MYNFSQQNNKEIKFFQVEIDENFFEKFKISLKDSDTEITSYNPVPYTWGLSRQIAKHEKVIFKINLIIFIACIIIFRKSYDRF